MARNQHLHGADLLAAIQHDNIMFADNEPAADDRTVVLARYSPQKGVEHENVVYANLAGKMEEQARLIVQTMDKLGLKRLIFISSMGIYHEAAGQDFGSALTPYRRSAEIIEQSELDYTIVRPAWLNDRDEIDYDITQKGQPFENPNGVVSRKSVADLVVKLATTPGLEVRRSLGVHKA